MVSDYVQTNLFSDNGPSGEEEARYALYDMGPGIKAVEITHPSRVQEYSPIQGYRLKRVVRESSRITESREIGAIASVQAAFHNYMKDKLMENTAVLYPFYYSKETFGDTPDAAHTETFRSILAHIKNQEGEIPRIVGIAPDPSKMIREDVRAGDYQKVAPKKRGLLISTGTKGKRLYGLAEECLGAVDYKYAATAFKAWLLEHPEVTNLVFGDMMTVKHLFPGNRELKTLSFGKAAYKVFTAMGPGNRKYRISFIPSHKVHQKYDEKTYGITADMLSILMHPGTEPEIKYEMIESVDHAQKILDDVIKYGNATVSLDIEATGLNPVYPDQKIISCAISDGKTSWGFLVEHPFERDERYDNGVGLAILELICYDQRLRLVMQNAAFDCKWLTHRFGKFPAADIRDTMLYDHWLFETQGMISKYLGIGYGYGMDAQIPRYLRVPSHKEMLDDALAKIIPLNSDSEINMIAKGKKDLIVFRPELIKKFLERMYSPDWREPGSGKYARLPKQLLLDYNRRDAAYTMLIYKKQAEMIREQLKGRPIPFVFKEIFPMLIRNTVEMSLNGIPIDYDLLETKLRVVDVELNKLREHLDAATTTGNQSLEYDSEVKTIAFLKKAYDLTDDDFWDVNEDKVCLKNQILEELTDDEARPLIRHIRDYRKLMKVRNTYFLPFLFASYKGRLYFDLDLTGTATGRFSARSPNIQNIPVKVETTNLFMGIKEVLTAEEGKLLMDMDLSSAEIKVLTTACPDEKLIKVLKEGLDAHSNTASILLERSYDEVRAAVKRGDAVSYQELTGEEKTFINMRQNSKRVNFGAIYRIGPRGLSSQIGLDDSKINYGEVTNRKQRRIIKQEILIKEAETLLENLFAKVFPKLQEAFLRFDKEVLEKGYGESIFGRRRRYTYTPVPRIFEIINKSGIYGKHGLGVSDVLQLIPSKRPFRQNMNYKVQSATSDYMVSFIHYINMKAKEAGIDLRLHITVHDSVVMSYSGVPEDYERIVKICDEGMNDYLMSLSDKLPVPIGYGIDISYRYHEMKK